MRGGEPHVVLVGMMGAGKTTTGTALAAALGRPFVDSDAALTERTGATGATLASRQDVAALHDLEAELLVEALADPRPAVAAAAASVVESHACRAALRDAFVVWLQVPTSDLQHRAARGDHRRPLSAPAAAELLERRSAPTKGDRPSQMARAVGIQHSRPCSRPRCAPGGGTGWVGVTSSHRLSRVGDEVGLARAPGSDPDAQS
jgi:shikimate kinase